MAFMKKMNFGIADKSKSFADEKRYEKLEKTCPQVDLNTRKGWLIVKQHFGPISRDEKLELQSLS
jgi:nitric oxide synthase oxygenase domain/subunit